MQARRRPRERDRPAARRTQGPAAGHSVDLPDDLHVDDLRPPRLRGLRAVQGRPAGPALRRRIRGLRLVRVRVPCRPFPWWPGCPPRLRSLLRSRSDCCRAFRASFAPIRSFELGVPESVLSISRRRSSSASRSSSRRLSSRSLVQPGPQSRDLRGPRSSTTRPQPRVCSTQPGSVIGHGLVGHAPQAPTPAATRQIDKRRSRPRLKPGHRHQTEMQGPRVVGQIRVSWPLAS